MTEILGYIATAFSPGNLIFALVGTILGIIVGALPGFTPTMGIAVLIPVTYTIDSTTALVFLGAIYCGSMFGGSISAILINTPGTSAAAATAMDGYAMTLKGKSHEALVESAMSSFWGGILSVVALLFLAPPLARFAFQFGPQERFMMALFGLTIIASLTAKSVLKGLMMGCVGLVLACIGIDPVQGSIRFTFGSTFFMGGIQMIPVVIGLFSMSQVFTSLKDPLEVASKDSLVQYKSSKLKLKDIFKYPKIYWWSSVIGLIVGIIPGTGGDVASYVAHNTGHMFTKDPDYGNGSREGVAWCEAANNAVTGGTLIPTLTLGVPGNATTAVLLSALTIQGLTPGYGLFTTEKEITYPFICALFIANVMMAAIGIWGAKYFARVTLAPKNILNACVLFLSVIGTYAIRGSVADILLMLVFGVIGYLLKLYKYNVVPIVLGLILGPIAEAGLSQALLLNNNSISAVFTSMVTRPICIVLFLCMVISVSYPYISQYRAKKKSQTS
ncbi:Tripartite tricarboxylate transporter TctA family [uncultured Clostridium sp.]|uniref:Tripartite tricarboxylate transporter permease n=1 Tax=Flintibacter hominis TaxID=2763048 RepID=A0A8J6JBS0_9FIRM|nr:tripartite tricarboxylate transporter permease [Flintibacter hominis]MBC5723628.1 tripartite tricarboxylate transporter permease [Flintibacter hominis]SCH82494.1 Tripartite tricarboxylate transporter TctA family [uncultured Clostridium sp.]